MTHETSVRHHSYGWLRWQPVCTCGWVGDRSNMSTAVTRAQQHRECPVCLGEPGETEHCPCCEQFRAGIGPDGRAL